MSKLAKCIAVQHVSVAHVDEAKICFDMGIIWKFVGDRLVLWLSVI